jgi:hypothetical protein
MRLTFVTDLGATYTIEIDPKMELENVMALLEAEVSDFLQVNTWPHVFPRDKSGVPPAEQSISYDGRELGDTKATMEGLGVMDDAMLLFQRKVNIGGRCFSHRWASHRATKHSFVLQDG